MPVTTSSSAATRHQEVTGFLQAGDLRAAAEACTRLNTEFPDFLPGWHSASLIALCRGQPQRALEHIRRALGQAPADPRFLLQNARCLSSLRRRTEALASAAAACEAAAADPALSDAIGSYYSAEGEYRKACEAYSRAIELDPGRALFWFNRAAVRRFLGELAGAEEDYDRAIALRPDDYEAYLNRAELRQQTAARNHIPVLEKLLAGGVSQWRGEVQIRHALAKEYEDLGEHGPSWQHLEAGTRLRRAHLSYDVGHDVDTVEWIIKAFPAPLEEPPRGCAGEEPIFIVGLPRSGTTLVERILGSHSAVFAAGELNHFAAALVAAAQAGRGGQPLPRCELVAATRELDFEALGVDYLERARPSAAGKSRFTDKMPLNYLYCGLIHRALPRGRIIHVVRHPMASCYAMFKTLFKAGYPFSYDLDDIARYYAAYRRLMDHWQRTLPGVIHEVSYERLVMDQKNESRRLLAACALEWEDACLDFHRNPTATSTASASQVRRPIYDTSLAQWRHYERQLEPLRTRLIAAGIDSAELD